MWKYLEKYGIRVQDISILTDGVCPRFVVAYPPPHCLSWHIAATDDTACLGLSVSEGGCGGLAVRLRFPSSLRKHPRVGFGLSSLTYSSDSSSEMLGTAVSATARDSPPPSSSY